MAYPSVLAFEGKITCSDALLFSAKENDIENKEPVLIKEKTVRGTFASKNIKQEANLLQANPQKIDCANATNDLLIAKYSVKFLKFDGIPNACNDKEFLTKISSFVEDYKKEITLQELAKRYAINIANARSLFRNRASAKDVKVLVEYNDEQLSFDALEVGLTNFDYKSENLTKLTNIIFNGLEGNEFTNIKVTVILNIGAGQPVYPSEEMILDSAKTKSKILYQINQQAAIHSQKIGNGIRTIDTFYSDEFEPTPIPVEPYGCVTSYAKVYREPKSKRDFYTYMNKINSLKIAELSETEKHYIISVLIRGGVFGGKK